MTTLDLMIAIIGGLALIMAGWGTAKGVAWSRLKEVEARMDRLERELEGEYAYSRMLVDHIYRGLPPPPPPRPTRAAETA
jgi:hypothetical protein